MLNSLLALIIIISPVISKFTGLLIFNLGFSFSTTAENLLKEAVYILMCLFAVITLSIFKKSNIRVLKGLIIFICIVCFLSVISVFRGVPIASVILAIRNDAVFGVCILVGFFYIKKRLFIGALKTIFVISMIVLSVEILLSPDSFWGKMNYFDYYLYRQDLAIERSDGRFVGYYNQYEVENVFRVFDKISQTGVYHYRYGSIIGEPIIFGHFFASMVLILFVNVRKKISKLLLIALMLIAVFMSHSKGCMVSILIYFGTVLFFNKKRLRIPIILVSLVGLSLFIVDAFSAQTSSVGHILNLLDAYNILIANPLFGIGMGISGKLTDDSFVGRLISDGGLILVFGYLFFIFSLFKQFKNNNKINEVGITFAAFIPTLLSTGAVNFLSMYLFCIYFGLQLRLLKPYTIEIKSCAT